MLGVCVGCLYAGVDLATFSARSIHCSPVGMIQNITGVNLCSR